MHLIPSCWRTVPTHPLVAAVEQELARRGVKALADDLDDLPVLVRLASRLAPRLRRQFLDAVLASRNSIDLDALAQAVLSGNLTSVEAAAKLSSVSLAAQATEPILRQGFLLGAQYALEAAQFTLRLDLVNPYATQWASSHAAELVTEISRETGVALRSIIESAFAEGRSPYDTARAIRDVVGLTSRQAAAVETFRARLLEDGIDPAKVASRTEKYSVAQLRWRSENIARTETLMASNQGQQSLWQEAKRQGLLDPERTRRVWQVTHDDRLDVKICEPLDGEETTLDEPFPGGIMSPPAHPSCWAPDHDVWALSGWKPIGTVESGEVLWTLNPLTLALEVDYVRHAWHQPYRGMLIRLHSRTVDLLVTPDHAIYCVSDWKGKHGLDRRPLERKSVAELKYGDRIPRSGRWIGDEPERITIAGYDWPAREAMRFVGWYLAEGSISKPARGSWQIKITQEKPEGRAQIEPLIRGLFSRVWSGREAFYLPLDPADPFIAWARAIGHAHEKRVPIELMAYDPGLLRELFFAFVAGDGTIRPSRWAGHPEWRFADQMSVSTSSPGLASDLTELAQKIGRRTTHSVMMPQAVQHWNGIYTARHPQHVIQISESRWTQAQNLEREPLEYEGEIIGFEMKQNPIVLVRRNGKTLWTGNCRCTTALKFLE